MQFYTNSSKIANIPCISLTNKTIKFTTIAEIEKFIEYYDQKVQFDLGTTEEESAMHNEFVKILNYQSFDGIVHSIYKELKTILENNCGLDNEDVQLWCIRTRKFYIDHIFYNELNYQDFDFVLNDNYYFALCNLQVNGMDFTNLNVFCKPQQILYWESYHLIPYERPKSDHRDYYKSSQSVQKTESKFEQLLNILNS